MSLLKDVIAPNDATMTSGVELPIKSSWDAVGGGGASGCGLHGQSCMTSLGAPRESPKGSVAPRWESGGWTVVARGGSVALAPVKRRSGSAVTPGIGCSDMVTQGTKKKLGYWNISACTPL